MHSVVSWLKEMSSFQGCPYRGVPLYRYSYCPVPTPMGCTMLLPATQEHLYSNAKPTTTLWPFILYKSPPIAYCHNASCMFFLRRHSRKMIEFLKGSLACSARHLILPGHAKLVLKVMLPKIQFKRLARGTQVWIKYWQVQPSKWSHPEHWTLVPVLTVHP